MSYLWLILGLSIFAVVWLVEKSQEISKNTQSWNHKKGLNYWSLKIPWIKIRQTWDDFYEKNPNHILNLAVLKKYLINYKYKNINFGNSFTQIFVFSVHFLHSLVQFFTGGWDWTNKCNNSSKAAIRATTTMITLLIVYSIYNQTQFWWGEKLNQIFPYFQVNEISNNLLILGASFFSFFLIFSIFSFIKSQRCYHLKLRLVTQLASRNYSFNVFLLENYLAREVLTSKYWSHEEFSYEFSRALYISIHSIYMLCPRPFYFSEENAEKEWLRFVNGSGHKEEAKIYLNKFHLILNHTLSRPKTKKTKMAEVRKVA